MGFSLDTIVARAKRRGFAYPGSDIYGGLANARDLGPYGVEIKRNIENNRRQYFIQEREDIIGLDSQILMNPKVWEASGHVGGFSDPLVDCKKCQNRERADQLIEDYISQMKDKYKTIANKLHDITKNLFKEMDNLEENMNSTFSAIEYYENIGNGDFAKDFFTQEKEEIDKNLKTHKNKLEQAKEYIIILEGIKEGGIDEFIIRFIRGGVKINITNLNVGSRTFDQQFAFLQKFKIKCPKCGSVARTEPKKFNLMFKTQQGIIEGEGTDIYLRPETAQGIFVNFKNILDTTRSRIPFGIGQIGKSFRNEITPGNFMFRVREFYQMEIEYFVENNEEIGLKAFEEWKALSKKRWIEEMGIRENKLKFRDHDKDELSFYSKGTCDVEYEFPWGRGELQGIAYRTDYDLKQHMEHSGKDMQYNDPYTGKRYVPHVIEPSRGLTRAILTAMIDAYDEEIYTDGNGNEASRVVARFHKNIAPIKFAIMPLVKKDEKMVAIARDIYKKLSKKYMCEFDDSGNIGKSYRRQDEIGTPYCITVDHQSIEDGTVTIRERDSMKQERVKPEDIIF